MMNCGEQEEQCGASGKRPSATQSVPARPVRVTEKLVRGPAAHARSRPAPLSSAHRRPSRDLSSDVTTFAHHAHQSAAHSYLTR